MKSFTKINSFSTSHQFEMWRTEFEQFLRKPHTMFIWLDGLVRSLWIATRRHVSFGWTGFILGFILLNFLFCRYTPVQVEHSGDVANGGGEFLLHQGIQRRIAITVVHEHGPELVWRGVKEVVVGRLVVSLKISSCFYSISIYIITCLFIFIDNIIF